MNQHEARLEQEAKWYTEPAFQSRHLVNRWPFYSERRNKSSYRVAKQRLFSIASKKLPTPLRILVAPCGTCDDYPFIRSVWPNADILGLDIAPYTGPEKTQVGDVLAMPYANRQFDLAVSNLFFHHVADEGFGPYLKELRRVAPSLISLEPSWLHPFSLVARSAAKVFGNVTGQVPHEHPISLPKLVSACTVAGYSTTETFACSFAHNRVPVPLRPFLNLFCVLPAIKNFAWQVGLIAQS